MSMKSRVTLSAIVHTLNEERNIRSCLESLIHWVDEIIIVDMYSDDKTVDICREFTRNVFFHERSSYGADPARPFAWNKASCDWLFVIDADERAASGFPEALQRLLETTDANGIWIPRKNLLFGRWLYHIAGPYEFMLRCFRRGKATWEPGVHTIAEVEGEVAYLSPSEDVAILHEMNKTVAGFIGKDEQCTGEEAHTLHAMGVQLPSFESIVVSCIDQFRANFFRAKGYRDGMPGFLWSALRSFYLLSTYMKLWELKGYPNLDKQVEKFSNEWHLLKTLLARILKRKLLRMFGKEDAFSEQLWRNTAIWRMYEGGSRTCASE